MSRFLIILLQFHPWAAILYDDVVENYDADENDEDPDNDEEDPVNEQYPDNEQIPYIGQDLDNMQIPYIDQDPDNEQDLEDRIICYLRPLKITAM